MNNNTILVTGAQGQLGRTMEYYWAASELARENELLFYDIGEYLLYYILIETHHITIYKLNIDGSDILFSFDDNPLDQLENIHIDNEVNNNRVVNN